MARNWLPTWRTGVFKKHRSRRPTLKPSVFALEDRSVPTVTSVSLVGGVLTIQADGAADTIQFQQWGGTPGQPLTYNTRVGVNPNVGSYNLLSAWSGQNGVPANTSTITGVSKVVIMGGGGNDNISVQGTTPAGTVIELYGEAGDDTLTGGGNTNDLLVGGLGNDTLNGADGNDQLYGDDVPTQTISPADPFTTSQSGGTTYTNLPSGSFFNQRRVARFNNATSVSVASATQDWKATLPNANSSRTALMYRQDFNLTPKDLTGLGSMAFDITVTGSVTGYWNLMDSNGYIAEVPGGLTLSAGNHTVTLDLSTAAIDDGFDLSKIVSMDISIAAASANSTIVVKNLRKGEFLPAPGGNDVLNGGGGADSINGQAGDDIINWGGGPGDVATGGLGNDIFIQDNNLAFQTLFGTITDFRQGFDKIRIVAAPVGLNAATATLVYGTTHQSNRIVVDTTSDPFNTILRLPVGNTGKIKLRGKFASLTLADFQLV